MAESLHLGLPYIAAAQAQKHVTHNEALRSLDAIVMLSVLDRDLTAPPGSPDEGDRYLVDAAATGGFVGKDGQIAHFRDGVWAFHVPRAGWIAHVADEDTLLVHDGSDWGPLLGTITELQNVTRFGLSTTADATNPLSAVLNNALFAARTAANGGDGDLRCKLSKESAGDTVSLLMQNNFSGRAEIGLTGDDDLHVKVSSDGTTWREGLVIAAATGKVSFPQGLSGVRELLTANRIYYVRSDGSNSNDGLANTSGGAWLTIQHAYDSVCRKIDQAGYIVTIQVANGSYGAGLSSALIGSGPIVIQGNTGSPSSVTVTTGGHSFTLQNANPFRVSVRGFKIVSSGGSAFYLNVRGTQMGFGNIEFGACAENHLIAHFGSALYCEAGYSITGGGVTHINAASGSLVDIGNAGTVTMTGTLAFAIFAVAADYSIVQVYSTTFSGGTITGARYYVDNARINTFGGGASFFPGNAAGATANNGIYA